MASTPENESPTKQSKQKPLYRTNNSNTSRPFASSASKRSSVQALTSIQYLQHSFSKMGLQNSNSFGSNNDLMEEPEEMNDKENEREVGGQVGSSNSGINAGNLRKKINRGLRISSSTNQQEQFQLNLPPTPTKPNMIRKLPWELKGNKLKEKKNVPTTKEIKLEIIDALNLLIDKWSLIYPLSSSSRINSTHQSESSTTSNLTTSDNSSTSSDIGGNFLSDLITSTTKAIRAIQHSIISLPPSVSPIDLFTSSKLSSTSSTATNNNQNLRQSSLLVLGTLQNLRDTYRLPSSSSSTPSNSIMMQGKGKASSTYDFSDDEKDSDNEEEDDEDEVEKGIEYRNDITLEDLRVEKEIVREYVEVIDRILLRAVVEKKDRRVASSITESTANGLVVAEENEPIEKDEEGDAEDSLPLWAREEGFSNDLDRVHAILSAHLSELDQRRLISPSISSVSFLESLLDGTLLCLAYNSVLRDSTRPFGFIPHSSIHRLESSSTSSTTASVTNSAGEKKVGTTFRKVENLRMFVAALKFRYLINLTILLPNGFDAKKLVRKEEGWEEMLQGIVIAWMKVVVEEKRAEEFE